MSIEVSHYEDVLSGTEEGSEVRKVSRWAGGGWRDVDVAYDEMCSTYFYSNCLELSDVVTRQHWVVELSVCD